MRWAVVLAGIAAGCFDPSVQPGAPCAVNGACPGALVCVNGTCERTSDTPDAPVVDGMPDAESDAMVDAMIDAMPMPDDADGDGVIDMVDNCPSTGNGDQHDEDNDSVGDVCDNCPHIANANQANVMDNDTVGDVCDPNPTLGGDSIARFLPMHVVPPMVTTMGTWTQMGDAYVHTDNQDSALVVQGGPWNDVTVVISGAQITNIVPQVWIAATVGETPAGYYHCGYHDQNSAGDTDYHLAVWGAGIGTNWDFYDAVEHFHPQRLAGAFTLRLRGQATAKQIDCTVNDARGTRSTGTEGAAMLAEGNVGVRSDGITYQVNYIVVFRR